MHLKTEYGLMRAMFKLAKSANKYDAYLITYHSLLLAESPAYIVKYARMMFAIFSEVRCFVAALSLFIFPWHTLPNLDQIYVISDVIILNIVQ